MNRQGSFYPHGTVVLITGAAQGIGYETAERFVRAGACVVLVDIDADQLDKAVAELGRKVVAIAADVRKSEDMAAAVNLALDTYGRLDVVVANAGITPPTATIRTIGIEHFNRVIDVNLLGAVNTVKAAIEPIIASGGHIQLIGSCAAFAPGMGGAAYMISKAGVEQLGRALRIELAPHNVSVGISYFGIVDTELTRATLNEDRIGRQIGELLPWPLNKRIDAAYAARTVYHAVIFRQATSIVPSVWKPYAWLRGLINIVLDRQLATSPQIADIVHQLDGAAAQ
ncbi:MAG: short-chain dehydrogenase/reductase [Mycobacterium sp.]|nr:short-chain dehydrogenase/reductase [Mycobacterium sp.]